MGLAGYRHQPVSETAQKKTFRERVRKQVKSTRLIRLDAIIHFVLRFKTIGGLRGYGTAIK